MSGWSRLAWVLTLRCAGASELSSRRLDEPLTTPERLALLGHLLACRSCRRFDAQLVRLRRVARRRDQAVAGPGLSPEARARIARTLREARDRPDADHPEG